MILLQICLLPLTVLLLSGAIFAIGASGLEQTGNSVLIDQDEAWNDERLSAVTTDYVRLPGQSQCFYVSDKDQVDLLQTEIVHGYSIRESLSELPIYKL
jgi:hypothetical protein